MKPAEIIIFLFVVCFLVILIITPPSHISPITFTSRLALSWPPPAHHTSTHALHPQAASAGTPPL